MPDVVVVGAGPVGLLTAFMLGQRGLQVLVLEANDQVDVSPRGLAYGPAATSVLRQAGILDEVIKEGLIMNDISWRRLDGEIIASTKFSEWAVMRQEPTVMLPVGSLSQLLVQKLETLPTVSVRWSCRMRSLGQTKEKAWVNVVNSDATNDRIEADFVVGCDGGTSTVRHQLSGRNFSGYTWPFRMVAVNIRYDFTKFGWSDAQWIVDPSDWFIACKIDGKGLWRVAYGESKDFPESSLKDRSTDRLRNMLPGHPEPSQYTIERIAPYNIHQRCVDDFQVGRVLLAGDAAHLNNPMGGLGLTTGIADVGSLVQCILGIYSGQASLDILNQYSSTRHKIFRDIVDPATTANLERLMQDPDVARADVFFHNVERAMREPEVAKELIKHDFSISADMARFYNSTDGVSDEQADKEPKPEIM